MASIVAPSYYPSRAEIEQYWEQDRVRADRSVDDVPIGLPRRIYSTLAWNGGELPSKRGEWELALSPEDLAAVEDAMKHFEETHQDLSTLSPSTFSLPDSLCQRLKQTTLNLYNGLGFQLIHGLDSSKYTARQNVIILAGIGAHVCPQRGFVDQAGEGVVSHIVNVQGRSNGPASTAPGFTSSPMSFHTDNCEIMAFHYLDTAPVGGDTVLSSSWQVYNDLAKKRPGVLHTLAQPWVMDTFKPYADFPPRHERLIQRIDGDRILFRFSRYGMTGWQRKRNPELPIPTSAQLEALDAVQMTAMANSFTIPAVKGDILFVNDLALFHARRGFEEQGQYLKRHLVKMFFRDPSLSWQLPAKAAGQREKMFGPNRANGAREESWNLSYEDGSEERSPMNG